MVKSDWALYKGIFDRWRRGPMATAAIIGIGAFILIIPSIMNGDVFFYWDSPTYFNGAKMGVSQLLHGYLQYTPSSDALRVPVSGGSSVGRGLTSIESGVYIAGRSVYYGMLLFLASSLGGLWLAGIGQAVLTSYSIFTFLNIFTNFRCLYFIGAIAIFAFLTPLGYLSGLMMPDLFTGLIVLWIIVLSHGWERLSRFDRIMAFLILAFGMLAHNSHPPLGAVLVALGLGCVRIFKIRQSNLMYPAALIASTVCIGLIGEVAFTQIATHAIGSPPIRLPFLSAHLVQMGPGTAYLRRHCPQAGFEICVYRDKFPVDWRDFMFSSKPASSVFASVDGPTKRRISNEQMAFAVAVLRDQPVATTGGLGLAFLQQIAMFRVDEMYLPGFAETIASRLPPSEFRLAVQSVVARPGKWDVFLTISTYVLAIFSVIVITVVRVRRRMSVEEDWRRLRSMTALVAGGLLANAAICGILASPYDRFQARVIWLLPLFAIAHLLSAGGEGKVTE